MRACQRPLALFVLLTCSLVAAQPAPPPSPPPVLPGAGALALNGDAGLDPATLSTLRALTLGQLRAQGVPMLDVEPQGSGATRIFVLTPQRLGQKLILTLDERRMDGTVVYSAQMTLVAVEESDHALPRLVSAVLRHQPAEETADLTNITEEESQGYRARSGRSHLVLGLPFGLIDGSVQGSFGFSIGYSFERESYRLNLLAQGSWSTNMSSDYASVGMDYVPLRGGWSPYFGGSVGYMFLSNTSGNNEGLGFAAQAGVIAFRLNRVQVLAGLELFLPTWEVAGKYAPDLLFHLQVSLF
jgi:hypothetical protein